jgi:hypothetical protein
MTWQTLSCTVFQLASPLLSQKTVVMPTRDKDKILCQDVRLEPTCTFLCHVLVLVYQPLSPRIIGKPFWDKNTFLLLRCNLADLLNMGKGQDPLSCTSIGKPISILREHRHAIMGQGHVPRYKTSRHACVGQGQDFCHDVWLESSMWEEDKFLCHVLALEYQQQSPRIIVKPLWDKDTFLCYDAI